MIRDTYVRCSGRTNDVLIQKITGRSLGRNLCLIQAYLPRFSFLSKQNQSAECDSKRKHPDANVIGIKGADLI